MQVLTVLNAPPAFLWQSLQKQLPTNLGSPDSSKETAPQMQEPLYWEAIIEYLQNLGLWDNVDQVIGRTVQKSRGILLYVLQLRLERHRTGTSHASRNSPVRFASTSSVAISTVDVSQHWHSVCCIRHTRPVLASLRVLRSINKTRTGKSKSVHEPSTPLIHSQRCMVFKQAAARSGSR
jgi:hypothetical protein